MYYIRYGAQATMAQHVQIPTIDIAPDANGETGQQQCTYSNEQQNHQLYPQWEIAEDCELKEQSYAHQWEIYWTEHLRHGASQSQRPVVVAMLGIKLRCLFHVLKVLFSHTCHRNTHTVTILADGAASHIEALCLHTLSDYVVTQRVALVFMVNKLLKCSLGLAN